MRTLATVVTPMIEPDEATIKRHLDVLFEPARWDYPDGLIEVVHGPASNPLSLAALFSVSEEGVAEAVKYAISVNRRGENTYVGVNPRKRGTNTSKRASDRDVEISFWQFADLDAKEAMERAQAGMPLRPNMLVMTGTEPHKRPHFYWRLQEPVMNLGEWTQRQSGIAQSLGGDSVINPSRVMRLAGTVNFPVQHKVERGYRVELTTLRTSFSNERPHVTPEQIAQAYPLRTNLPAVQPGQTTLGEMAAARGKTKRLIDAALNGNNWHENVRDLTAHLAGKGRTDVEIMLMAPGLTLPGYTVDQTEREMRTMLAGARQKYGAADDDDVDPGDAEPADSVFETLSLDQIEALPPPTYLIDDLIPEHGITFIYGAPGARKSFVALDMALRLAFGMNWHGRKIKRTGVLYIAGEGRHGMGKRVTGWRKEHGLEGADAPFKLLPVAVHMLDAPSVAKLKRTIDAVAAEVGFSIGLIIIDTVSRSIPGHDENKQDTMSLFVDGCADLHDYTGGAVLGVHHSGKDIERGMRGSNVLLGGCEASIKITKEGDLSKLEVEKQKDEEESEPIYLGMKKLEWATGLDKPLTTLVPFMGEEPDAAAEAARTLSRSQIGKTFDEIDSAWIKKKPWSVTPNTRASGRYMPAWMASEFLMKESEAASLLSAWLMREFLTMEVYDSHSKGKGLRVLRRLDQ